MFDWSSAGKNLLIKLLNSWISIEYGQNTKKNPGTRNPIAEENTLS